MTVDEIHGEVVRLEGEIEALRPGDPELAAVVARIRELEGELERARGALGPLVPDAASPKSPEEISADELGEALGDLMRAATAKQEPVPT
jgi:hypothetical protein